MKDYLIEKMITLKARYAEVNRILVEEAADKEPSFIAKLSKELSVIEEPVSLFAQYEKNEEQLEEAKEMIKESDPELKLLGQEEFDRITAEQKDLYNRMQVSILPKDENDSKNIIVEIRGAVGGEEADLFAGDLYRMYLKYADAQHWKVQLIDDSPTTLGGYSSVSFMIKGKNVYSRLKFESGSHRVQRVPKTETNGRIHTSTATVLVMPETPAVDVVINPADLQIDTYRSQGAGGQNVNKTESAVRITHIPTGIVVACQVERSQIQNREIAMNLLRARIKAKYDEEREAKIGSERRLKVGTGERSEKIRTYNYPQNRVTDHRIGFTIQKLDRVMEGDLDEILDALKEANERDLIIEANKEINLE